MGKLKKFVGNFVEVVDKIGLADDFYEIQSSLEAYSEQVVLDESRTSYANFSGSCEELKKELRNTKHLTPETASFTQGGFDAGALAITAMNASPRWADRMSEGSDEEPATLYGHLRIAYKDDDGKLCGLTVAYVREDPPFTRDQKPVPVENRRRLLSISMIRDSNLPLAQRSVVHLGDPLLLPAAASENNTKEVAQENLADEINQFINSKQLKQLLTGLFNADGNLSVPYLNELKSRLSSGNLDNRDIKKTQLTNYLEFATKNFNGDSKFANKIAEIKNNALQDVNFFADKNFQKNLEHLFATIEQAINSKENADQTLHAVNKLMLFVSFLEIKTESINGYSSQEHRYIQYTKTIEKLRTLIQKPSLEQAKDYHGLTLEQLFKIEDEKAENIKALLQLIQDHYPSSYKKLVLPFLDYLEQKNKQHLTDNFNTDTNSKEQIKQELATFLANQKDLVELNKFLSVITKNIENLKQSIPPYLHQLLKNTLRNFELGITGYMGKTQEELLSLFLDRVFANEHTNFKAGSDYLHLPENIKESNSSEKSDEELFKAKLLERASLVLQNKNQQIASFYKRLEKLQSILSPMDRESPLINQLQEKINNLLKERNNPVAEGLIKYGQTTSLTNLIYKFSKETIAAQKEKVPPKPTSFWVRDRATLSVGIISFALLTSTVLLIAFPPAGATALIISFLVAAASVFASISLAAFGKAAIDKVDFDTETEPYFKELGILNSYKQLREQIYSQICKEVDASSVQEEAKIEQKPEISADNVNKTQEKVAQTEDLELNQQYEQLDNELTKTNEKIKEAKEIAPRIPLGVSGITSSKKEKKKEEQEPHNLSTPTSSK